MTTNIQWNDNAMPDPEGWAHIKNQVKAEHYTQPNKDALSYRGFIAPRHRDYTHMYGPAVDSNGNTVDGLPGNWSKDTAFYRAVDTLLQDQARDERAKLDALAQAKALKQMEDEAELIETERPTISAMPAAKKIQVTSRANVGEAFEEERKDKEINARSRKR